MKRLFQTIRLDITLQMRNYLYTISIGVALLLVIVFRAFFSHELLKNIIPTFYLFAVGGTTMLFVAGLVLFEKSENTLNSLILTPLLFREYLLSKVVSLWIIVLIESSIITFISYGFELNLLILLAGISFMAIMLTLIGFVLAIPYQQITDFILPAGIIGVILQLPFLIPLDILGVIEPLFYLIPTNAPYILLQSAFITQPIWAIGYGFSYSIGTIICLWVLAHHSFNQQLIHNGGM